MAFWKKSEDPWDMDPEQRRSSAPGVAEDGGQAPGLLDQVKDWRAQRARKQAEQTPDPIPCPWCGGELEPGYLSGGRSVWWAPGAPTFTSKWISVALTEGAFQLADGGLLSTFPLAWYCKDCRKVVVEVQEPYRPEFDTGEDPQENEEKGEN